MQIIDAANLDYRAVNEALRSAETDCTINRCPQQPLIVQSVSALRSASFTAL